MLSSGPPAPLKWYYRPAWVLFLLFGVLGKSPRFSRSLKVVLTVLVVVYMALFIEETMRVFRAVESELKAFGTVADF